MMQIGINCNESPAGVTLVGGNIYLFFLIDKGEENAEHQG
jgi:hypothetical protein